MKTIRNLVLTLLLVTLALFATTAYAATQTQGDWKYEDTSLADDGTVRVTEYIGSATTVTVPAKLTIGSTEHPVVVESTSTFWGSNTDNITDVTFESGVTFLNNNADSLFLACTNLKTVTGLPNSITSMQGTFTSCAKLETAPTIPSGVKNMFTTFYHCSSLKTAPTIPSGVENMQSTFQNCSSLETAPTIPAKVTNMKQTFHGCSSLKTAPTIPSGVENMQQTFSGCSSLETAPTIPSGVENMQQTFQRCSALKGTITILANPSSYANCFDGAATGDTLTVNFGSTVPQATIDAIIATNLAGNVVKGTAVIIPSSGGGGGGDTDRYFPSYTAPTGQSSKAQEAPASQPDSQPASDVSSQPDANKTNPGMGLSLFPLGAVLLLTLCGGAAAMKKRS